MAKVCTRPLGESTPKWFNFSPYPDSFNLNLNHEHVIFDDEVGGGTGYGGDGIFDDSGDERYQCKDTFYDDQKMRQAAENIKDKWKDSPYGLVNNNCQDYVTDLINEYNRL